MNIHKRFLAFIFLSPIVTGAATPKIYTYDNAGNRIKSEAIANRPKPVIKSTKTSLQEVCQVYVYPNPTSDILHVYINGQNPKGYTVSLFDISGKLLLTEIFPEGDNEINISGFNAGIYVLQLDDETIFSHTHKIVKH